MNQPRSIIYMAGITWAAICFIVAVVASCSTFPAVPERIDPGAVRHAAAEVFHAL